MKTNWQIEDFLADESFVNWANGRVIADIEYWNKWLQEHPEASEMVATAKYMVKGIPFQQPHIPQAQVENAWGKLEKEVFPVETETRVKNFRRRNLQWWYYSAAAVMLLCMLGWAIFNQTTQIHWTNHKTAYGEQKELILPDGSKVRLNANSSIRYVENFKNENREVWLEGEAFFEVETKDDLQNFQVHTTEISVQVTGTLFNVNTHLKHITIDLVEGKVILSNNSSKTLALDPGNAAYWDNEAVKFVAFALKGEQAAAWRYNKWIFDQNPLSDVLERLAYTYGMSYEVSDDSLLEREVSGEINLTNEDELIDALAYLLDVHIEKTTNHLLIKEKP